MLLSERSQSQIKESGCLQEAVPVEASKYRGLFKEALRFCRLPLLQEEDAACSEDYPADDILRRVA